VTSLEYFNFELDQAGNFKQLQQLGIFQTVLNPLTKFDWNDTYLLINPVWPDDNLINQIPQSSCYVLAWMSEHIDIFWTKKFALAHPNSKILALVDSDIFSTDWLPNNVTVVRWMIWPYVVHRMIEKYGSQDYVSNPNYHITSLCNRVSQYKFYASAYLLNHSLKHKAQISYHAHIDKFSDIDHLRVGDHLLDSLVDRYLDHPPVSLDAVDSTQRRVGDVFDWNWKAFTDSVVCLTNEGNHYSFYSDGNYEFVRPGPFLTEKTFKPLLSGQALLPVGQAHTYKYLETLGFNFDYGFDKSFDQDSGDLSRIKKLFFTIDKILEMDLQDLWNSCKLSTEHNSQWIRSKDFLNQIDQLNQISLYQIDNWLKNT